jgi:hypothetical protein
VKFLLDHDVPDDLSYLLEQLTCNRDDLLHLAATKPKHGVVIVILRNTRAEEREKGLGNNINFA